MIVLMKRQSKFLKRLTMFDCKNFSDESCSQAKLTNVEVHKYRSRLFQEEKDRQKAIIKKIEKIKVDVYDPLSFKDKSQMDKPISLMMNKHLSTPFECAMHLNEVLCSRSVLALLDGSICWDMHKPLYKDCRLDFIHFLSDSESSLELVNKAYWRSCSMILGYVLESCFRDEYFVELCSFPPASSAGILNGVFFFFFKDSVEDWAACKRDLRCMSIRAYEIRENAFKFEPLAVTKAFAKQIFLHNRFKFAQVDEICKDETLNLYRVGDFVDISKGPMIANCEQIGRFELSAIHNFDSKSYGERLQRVQALSIPNQLRLHYWTFDFLVDRAAKLNRSMLPSINLPVESCFVHEHQ